MHLKALRRKIRKEREAISCNKLAPDGKNVTIMDVLNSVGRIETKILRKSRTRPSKIIRVECPQCHKPMEWNNKWQAFECTSTYHRGGRGLYEVIQN